MTVGRFFVSGSENEKENMAYTSGLLKHRVTILNKQVAAGFGETTSYQPAATVWADMTWNKGVKALREGALDAYDTVMFRMRYHEEIDRWCVIQYLGKWYQILSFNADYQENQIQITAQEMANPPEVVSSEG